MGRTAGWGGGRIGLVPVAAGPPDLAIASCGNAALAAAVVARAADRRLQVFIPTVADPKVVARLRRLEAELTICPREEGVTGDPTYHRLRQAGRQGALPFPCPGGGNGVTHGGGKGPGRAPMTVWPPASSIASSGNTGGVLLRRMGPGSGPI